MRIFAFIIDLWHNIRGAIGRDEMKIAIVDDEISEQEILIKYIREWADAKRELAEITRFDSSESFLFSWEDDKAFSLLILDIEMGGISGLELAKKIRAEDKRIPIMFVTGYDEYMQYGYDVSALHYLIKPVHKERLFMVLDKLAFSKTEEIKALVLHGESGVRRVQIRNILYLEADGHGSIMHTVDEVFSLKESLGEIEKQAPAAGEIIKCHRAYLVNLRFISAIQNSDIILDNRERLPVSRNQMKKVQREFLKYYV